MSQFWKYTLIIVGANLLFILLGLAEVGVFILWFFLLFIQLLVGIGMIIPQSTRILGQAFLLSFAIVLVIGLSVCSMIPNTVNFH